MFKIWQKSFIFIFIGMAGIFALLFSSASQAAPATPLAAGDVIRVSEATTELSAHSYMGDISANGRYTVFSSSAENVVPNDTNGVGDIFRYDNQSGDIIRVSVASNGTEADAGSGWPVISGDGRYIAFHSDAANLVSGDTNGQGDVFVHDSQSGTTTRVSINTNGAEGNGASTRASISANGRYVTFHSAATNLVSGDTNGVDDIFIHDIQTGITSRASTHSNGTQGNGNSSFARISADGHYVVFYSSASNLVNGDANGVDDVFRHTVQSGETIRVSVATGGAEGNGSSQQADISANGRYIVFESSATNLIGSDTNGKADIFKRDVQSGTTSRVSIATDSSEGDGAQYDPAISDDGRYVVFGSTSSNLVSGITTGTTVGNIFRRDTQTNSTIRISVATDGAESDEHSYDPVISNDGRYIAFYTTATTLVDWDTNGKRDIFLHDVQMATTKRISLATSSVGGDKSSGNRPAISADGRYVAFSSSATNLVADDTNFSSDVFVHDMLTGLVRRVSVASDGTQGDNSSYPPAISGNGRYVVFASRASNLVAIDTNGQTKDIFIHDLETGSTSRVSDASNGTEANGESSNPVVSENGRYVAFSSEASNLVSGDTNGKEDVFLHDTQTGNTSRISVASAGTEANNRSLWPAISGDGLTIIFGSYADNLVSGDTNNHGDIFSHDVVQGTTTRLSVSSNNEQGNGSSLVTMPDMSVDGRYILFLSAATNLVANPADGALRIFVRDTQAGSTSQVVVPIVGGGSADGATLTSTISDDGRYIAFSSMSTNLVNGDTNGWTDAFVHDRETGGIVVASRTASGQVGNGRSDEAIMAGNGRFVAYHSSATDLINEDVNGFADVFLYEVEEIVAPTFTIYLPMTMK